MRKGFMLIPALLVISTIVVVPLTIIGLVIAHHSNVINATNSPVVNVFSNQMIDAHMGKNNAQFIQKDLK